MMLFSVDPWRGVGQGQFNKKLFRIKKKFRVFQQYLIKKGEWILKIRGLFQVHITDRSTALGIIRRPRLALGQAAGLVTIVDALLLGIRAAGIAGGIDASQPHISDAAGRGNPNRTRCHGYCFSCSLSVSKTTDFLLCEDVSTASGNQEEYDNTCHEEGDVDSHRITD
jgi:hypothetical protein